MEIMIVEKQLRADVVGTRIDFCFEVIHFLDSIRSSRMTFRKSRHADSKSPGIAVTRKLADEPDQIDRVRKLSWNAQPLARWIAPHREEIPDASSRIMGEDAANFPLRVTDAS